MNLKHLHENAGMRLKDVCDINTNMRDADFWIVRKGSMETVGTVTKEFSSENIGIKVRRTDILLPDYLYYAMQHIQMQGYWKSVARGTLKLVNIRTDDVKNVRLG